MATRAENILTTCGREAGRTELEHAQEVLRLCRGLSRKELALTLCEHWGWESDRGPAGARLHEAAREVGSGRTALPSADGREQAAAVVGAGAGRRHGAHGRGGAHLRARDRG